MNTALFTLKKFSLQAVAGLTVVMLLLTAMPVQPAYADTTVELLPTGAGTYSSWTGTYGAIDEGTAAASCESADYMYTDIDSARDSASISLTSIPDGSTITSINVLARDRAHTSGSGGTYATFIRLNGTDSANSATHAAAWSSGPCVGIINDPFTVNTVKGASTTLEIGVVKINTGGASNNAVRVGVLSAVITYTPSGATIPTVMAVTSSAPNGFYNTADNISIQVTFSGTVYVTGTPGLTLETGTTDRTANYASGSGSNILNFTYNVQAGDTSADLDYVSTSALALNGGTIRDAASNNAGLSLPAPGAAGSLGANKSIFIDTAAPSTSITNNPTNPSSNNNPVFSFTGNDGTGSGVASFECRIDTATFSACNSGSTFGPLSNASHTFDVRAIDRAGNTGAVASYTWTIDSNIPSVTIDQASGQADPTNSSPINFTVAFSKPVSGFVTGDVTLGGTAGASSGIVTEIAPNNGTTYNVAVSGMASDGTVTASIAANVAVDAFSNPNTASTSTDNSVIYNTMAPETVIESSPGNPSMSASASFSFHSPDADVLRLECSLDNASFSPCTSPQNLTGLSGGSHTFQVRAVDNTNNVDPSPASFTWIVDLGYPTLSGSMPATGAAAAPGLTQLTVTFSEDVKNDGSAEAANNPANYLLVENGTNNAFDTLSCLGGLVADDTLITITGATYTNNGGSGPFVATLTVNALPAGIYRLFICGTKSIHDLAGNTLNNATNDSLVTFTLDPSAIPNTGSDTRTSAKKPVKTLSIPATGFPQGIISSLPIQPADKAYASTDLWLEIPKLGVKMSIVGVPQTANGWDVSWLEKQAGWLNGSAYPTWKGNSVLTAHVWDALNRPGPFVKLKDLTYGDQIKIHSSGQVFVYELRENQIVLPSNTAAVFKHEEKSWLTLVTCEEYSAASQTYSFRRLVRAVLVTVAEEE